jgi:hypothetical protein
MNKIDVLHIILILAAYSTPLWLNWELILLVAIILQLQYIFLGGCYLTFAQYGKTDKRSFYTIYLNKLGIRANDKIVKIIVRLILPIVLVTLAYYLENIVGMHRIWKY